MSGNVMLAESIPVMPWIPTARIWHGRGGRRRGPNVPTRILRGVLAADAEGIAEFEAIRPGFHGGRAVHTHCKVHVGNAAYLTSQALNPEEWNDRISVIPLVRKGVPRGGF